MKEKRVIRVGIADLNVVHAPDQIMTSGLGSCVGVVIYDCEKKVAGLSHVLLPDSSVAKKSNIKLYKYADTAIPILIDKLISIGARKSALKAKMAGGAQMFQFPDASSVMRIGPRNVEAVQDQLNQFRIPIEASDVGGNLGRTIVFDPETCSLKVRKVNKKETFL